MSTVSPRWSPWPWVSRIASARPRRPSTAAFGLPVRNGSTSTVVSPSESSKADVAEEADVHCHRVSPPSVVMSSCASSNPTATPISIATRVSSAISVRTACRRSSMSALPAASSTCGLVGGAEPVGLVERLVEDALQLRRVRRDEALRLLEPARVGERLDGGVDLGVGVRAAGGHWASYDAMAVPPSPPSPTAPAAAASSRPPTCARSSPGCPAPTDPRVLVGDRHRRRRRRRPAHATTSRSCRPSTSSRRSSTTPTPSGGSPRRTRCRTSTRWAARRSRALNLVAYPLETLGPEVLREILRGGADAVAAAGASIVGGHSIDDPEPKYGLAVTGIVHPRRGAHQRGRPRRATCWC